MTTEPPPMSGQWSNTSREIYMAGLLDDDMESWARLSGLLAVLALPPLRLRDGTFRKPLLEIEVSADSDRWMAVEGVTVEATRLIFHAGSNGTRRQIVFERAERVPRWRQPQRPGHPASRVGDGG